MVKLLRKLRNSIAQINIFETNFAQINIAETNIVEKGIEAFGSSIPFSFSRSKTHSHHPRNSCSTHYTLHTPNYAQKLYKPYTKPYIPLIINTFLCV